jgi:hypothetical protein
LKIDENKEPEGLVILQTEEDLSPEFRQIEHLISQASEVPSNNFEAFFIGSLRAINAMTTFNESTAAFFKCALIYQVYESKRYVQMGYPNFEEFAEKVLHLKKSQAYALLNLTRIFGLPAIKSLAQLGLATRDMKVLGLLPEPIRVNFLQEGKISYGDHVIELKAGNKKEIMKMAEQLVQGEKLRKRAEKDCDDKDRVIHKLETENKKLKAKTSGHSEMTEFDINVMHAVAGIQKVYLDAYDDGKITLASLSAGMENIRNAYDRLCEKAQGWCQQHNAGGPIKHRGARTD